MKIYLQFLFLALTLFLVKSNFASAQKLVQTVPFSMASAYIEPEAGKFTVKLSSTDFISLCKTKGGLTGETTFLLERFSENLQAKYKIPLVETSNENYRDLYFNGTDLILFSVFYNKDEKTSKLLAYGFDINTGAKKWDKVLQEVKVGTWADLKYKGEVKETFENSIAANIGKNFATPLEYQYEIKFSPDSNHILTYIFDYSQKILLANAVVFDKNLNKTKDGIVPIDNNFTNFGIFINKREDIFILNSDHLGRIVVIKYDLVTKDNKLLDIQYSSSQRQGLQLKFLSDDVVYVANITTQKGKFLGLMYSKFNFNTNLVEKINFHDISEGLLQTIMATRKDNKNVPADDNWLNYHITDFILNEFGKVILVLEKREIIAADYMYESTLANDIQHWKEHPGKVNTEGVLLFSFNADDELMWENCYIKSQLSDITTGMSSSSFVLDNTVDGKLRMVYGSSTGSGGVFNVFNYVEWDEQNGSKVKEVALPNEEGLTLVRNYTVWWDNKLVLVGRKGLMGKKSFLSLYSL